MTRGVDKSRSLRRAAMALTVRSASGRPSSRAMETSTSAWNSAWFCHTRRINHALVSRRPDARLHPLEDSLEGEIVGTGFESLLVKDLPSGLQQSGSQFLPALLGLGFGARRHNYDDSGPATLTREPPSSTSITPSCAHCSPESNSMGVWAIVAQGRSPGGGRWLRTPGSSADRKGSATSSCNRWRQTAMMEGLRRRIPTRPAAELKRAGHAGMREAVPISLGVVG